MSENNFKKDIQADWSLKDLNETDQRNLLNFFELLLRVDKRVKPELYGNHINGQDNQKQ